jgi:2-keto-3-deoxy-L-fuconate dehydrogenase
MADLTGKIVLLTAAAQGIGRASALAFARAGAVVHATDVNETGLQDLAGEKNIVTRRLDVLSDADVAAAVGEIGRVDVLFNCAGFVHAGSILEMTDADLDFALNLNVKSMIRTIRAVLPGMLERGDGSIINMASVAGSVKGVPNRFAYGVTKAAVVGLTKAVAADYVAKGYAVTASARARWKARRSTSACGRRAIMRRRAPPSSPASRWAGWARRRRSPISPSIWPAQPIRPVRPTTSTAAGRSERFAGAVRAGCKWRRRACGAHIPKCTLRFSRPAIFASP